MLTATRAAFFAPLMATVAHRHAGRHLHNGEQGIEPRQRLDFTAISTTGSVVIEAIPMPGRCAAPPAPGDDDLYAAGFGRLGILGQQVGRAVRRHNPLFIRHAERFERLGGRRHHLQSLTDPMMTPTFTIFFSF